MTAWKKEAILNNERCVTKKTITAMYFIEKISVKIIVNLSLYDCKKCIFIHSLEPFHITEEVLGLFLLLCFLL